MTLRWIFGYGSLIFRPGFAVQRSVVATLPGYVRRFWQGSPDHRGTPEAPGRVLTLVPAAYAAALNHDDDMSVGDCVGVAFFVDVDDALLRELDHREKAGYVRETLSLRTARRERDAIEAIVYVADVDNDHFLGAASLDDVAAHIANAAGPSGDNRSYLVRLKDALDELGINDPHVTALAQRVSCL